MTKKKNIIPRKFEDLTIKQRRWVKFYLKTGNGTEAALKSYNTIDRVTAAAIGSENLRKLREPVKMLMEAQGLSLGRLLEVLNNGLEANKIHGTNDNFVEIPDHKIRHAFLQTAGRWLGVEGKKTPGVAISKSQFNFFSVSSEKRRVFNKKFSEFLRSGAYDNQEVETEDVQEVVEG